MPTLPELREKLRRPLELERLRGCENRAVAGGLEKLLSGPLAGPFPQVREVLRGYNDLGVSEREEALEEALQLLQDGPPRPQAQPRAARQDLQPLAPVGETLPPDTALARLEWGHGGLKKLGSLGLQTLRDVLHNYPRRHEDRRALPRSAERRRRPESHRRGRDRLQIPPLPRPGMQILDVMLMTASGRAGQGDLVQPAVGGKATA